LMVRGVAAAKRPLISGVSRLTSLYDAAQHAITT
jgi:hypothetical protein